MPAPEEKTGTRQRGRRRKCNLARSFQSWQEPKERGLCAPTTGRRVA